MRRLLLLSVMLGAIAPAFAQAPPAPAAPRPPREAVVANDSARAMLQLFLAPADAGEEGPDRLGDGTLPPRATIRIPLERARTCQFTLRAVFVDGEEERRRVDLCRTPRIVLNDAGPRRAFEVLNATDLALREFYAWPTDQPGPGRDRLGANIVAAGDSLGLVFRNTTACVFDLRAVFEDDSVEPRARVDLCRAPRVVFGDPDAPLHDLAVSNRGRGAVRELYLRPNGAREWGPDRLGSALLEPRGTIRIRIRGRGCAYELRAVRDDGREERRGALDLCTETSVVLGGAAVAEAGTRKVTLTNGFGRTIRELFLAPAESGAWGDDALGRELLPPGGRHEVEFDGGCRADLRIVFETSAAEERRDIDICATPALALRAGWTLDPRLGGRRGPEASQPQTGSVRLRNAAALPVVELFADPPGAPRGRDRLGRTVLGAGESIDFAPPDDLVGPERCQAALVAVFRDGREVRRDPIDLCAGEEVELR